MFILGDIVYFELNNWFMTIDYPGVEPFISWMGNDENIAFANENWVKKNKLCVVADAVDMSLNFCITAKRKWVEENCPILLTDRCVEFLRFPNQDGDVYGRFGHSFLDYCKENIGLFWMEDD